MKLSLVFKTFGNLLIILSLLGLFYIYLPILQLYLFQQKIDPINYQDNTWYLEIPKIKASSIIIPNINPWQKSEYEEALQKGVAAASGFALPDQPGTIFLFAHSSQEPWKMTRTNTIFFRLNELKVGDIIKLTKDNKIYEYKVSDKKTLNPYDTKLLEDKSKNQLILQTCTPPGTDFQRLLIFANPT